MKKPIVIVLIGSVLSACASSPDKIFATYVSPIQYSNLDCDQIRQEMSRVAGKVREVAGVQQQKANTDKVAMGVGLVLFWPALFFMVGGDKKEELGRLKGEYDALDQAAIQKKCGVAPEIASKN